MTSAASLVARRIVAGSVTERAFTSDVVSFALASLWLVHHCRPAMMRSGRWATPLQGSPGLPDLVLARAPRLVFVELKTVKGVRRVTHAQNCWLSELNGVPGVEAYIWTPLDWRDIHRVLAA